jgi:3-methylcrotonyl-CoA carboxylase alpha subunit
MARSFDTLLIANRGEIACRIIRTARRMGLRTVAVFSEADRNARHVALADEAWAIGPAPAAQSYLDAAKIIDVARQSGAGAVHPGYGFLSENAAFAAACADAGLVFVGPPPAAIRAMGSKSEAKRLMEQAGVPLVPGYHGAAQDDATLADAAHAIGYPVLIKATAGGGGKGMRLVASTGDFPEALSAARREARSAFGDETVLVEKFIERPRHVEVQVFGDMQGNVVSLFERECTLQRRHQKVVEEAPSVLLGEEDRERICAAARKAALAVGYVGAGTVEFVANEDGFHFIEMNTRLQVEHPVTEMITGLDLVEWQLRVARGEPLPLRQEDISRVGHSIEARIYAEDPESGFLPSIGTLAAWRQPEETAWLRVETGFRQGDLVTPHYDPMLAKLVVHGADRDVALARLRAGLDAFFIAGVKTNIGFLRALADDPDVAAGRMDTGLIDRKLSHLAGSPPPSGRDLAAAAAAVLGAERHGAPAGDPWAVGDGFMIAGRRRRSLAFATGADTAEAVVSYGREGLRLDAGGLSGAFSWAARPDGRLAVSFDDRIETVHAIRAGDGVDLATPRGRFQLRLLDPFGALEAADEAGGHIRAPMPGTVLAVHARAGDAVAKGAPVLVLEAMKMEHVLRAPFDGRITSLACSAGDFVTEGTELAVIEPQEAAASS